MPEHPLSIGLRQSRDCRGVKQVQLAKLLGVSSSRICFIESRPDTYTWSNPRLKLLERAQEALEAFPVVDETPQEDLPALIDEKCKELSLTRRELASRLGMHLSCLCRIRKGQWGSKHGSTRARFVAKLKKVTPGQQGCLL